MNTIKYSFRMSHPRLFSRCEKPVEEIPVFYNGKVQCTASMDDLGQFVFSLPDGLAKRLSTEDAYIQPEWASPDVTAYDEDPPPIQILSLRIVDVPFLY